MTTRNMAYDHPAYTNRLVHAFTPAAAGAGGVSQKFVAFTALTIFALLATAAATGSSTYASLWNGTATIPTGVGAQTYSLIRIFNTAAAGATPALGTATYGPFMLSLYDGTGTNTQTNSSKPGFSNYVQLFNANGTSTAQVQAGTNTGNGGFQVNQGDQLYVVQGTDATAVGAYALEYGLTPLANVSN